MVMLAEKPRDIRGRLREARDAQDGSIARFEYDAYGRRVTKYSIATSETEHFYHDDWRVIYQHNGGVTSLSVRNVWGLYLDEAVVRTSLVNNKDYSRFVPRFASTRQTGTRLRASSTPLTGKPSLIDSRGDPATIDYPCLLTGQGDGAVRA